MGGVIDGCHDAVVPDGHLRQLHTLPESPARAPALLTIGSLGVALLRGTVVTVPYVQTPVSYKLQNPSADVFSSSRYDMHQALWNYRLSSRAKPHNKPKGS